MINPFIKIRHQLEKHPFLFSLVFNTVLLCIPILTGTMKYEVSDDFLMQILVSGAYSGKPAPWILFMNPIAGNILSLFYNLFPDLNWYALFQIVLLYTGMTLIGWLILRKNSTASLILFILFSLFALDFYQLLQFTKTAALCAGAGTICIIEHLRKKNWTLFSLSLFYFFCASIIRFKVLLLAGPPLIVLGLYALFSCPSQKRLNCFKRCALSGLAVLLIMGGTEGYARFFNASNPDYNTACQYSSPRSTILDYTMPAYEEIAGQIEQIGLSENDYRMITTWRFADTRVFTQEKMEQVADVMEEWREQHKPTLFQDIKTLAKRNYLLYICFWIALLSTFILTFFYTKSFRYILPLALTSFGVLLLNQLLGRIVYRVEFAIFFQYTISILTLASCGLILPESVHTEKRKTFLQSSAEKLNLALLILCVITYTGLAIPKNDPDKYDILNASWANNLKKYGQTFSLNDYSDFNQWLNEHPDDVYFLDFYTGIQNYYLAFGLSPSAPDDIFSHLYYLAGVDTLNPSKLSGMSAHGITTELSSLTQNGVYLVINQDEEMINQYLHEHNLGQGHMSFVTEKNGFKIWQYSDE